MKCDVECGGTKVACVVGIWREDGATCGRQSRAAKSKNDTESMSGRTIKGLMSLSEHTMLQH